jgi:hypothetical protein
MRFCLIALCAQKRCAHYNKKEALRPPGDKW